MENRQTKVIQWTINLPMDFPYDWDDDMIEFHLNESSWCCSNLISELEKYDEKNGCICGICEAKIAEKIGEQHYENREYKSDIHNSNSSR